MLRITILLLLSGLTVHTQEENVTEPDLNTDRVVMKNSIAYHFIKHVRNIEAEVLITRRISISPLVIGIQQMADTKITLQGFCDGIADAVLRAYNGHIPKIPSKLKRSVKEYDETLRKPMQKGHRRRRSATTKKPGSAQIPIMIADPTIQITQDICNSIAAQISEIETRSRERLTKVLNLVDISITINATNASREKRGINPVKMLGKMAKGKQSLGLFLLKTGVRSIWSLFGFVERIRTNRRLNRLEKDVSKLQVQQEKTSSMVDQLALVVTNHSILLGQLQVTTAKLTQQVNDLTDRVKSLDERLNMIRSMFQVTIAMSLLQSVVDRTRDAMDHGFYILEHIVDKALMSETSAHLLPAEQIRKVQVEVSLFSNAVLDPEYHRMKSVIVSDPENPEYLRAIISVAALSRRNYELVELIPVPLFKTNRAIRPSLSHKAVILNHEEGIFTGLDPREMVSCLRNEHCVTTGPELRTNVMACGMPQFFDWHTDKCEFEPILSSGIFLKRLGSDGIIFSLKDPVNAQLFCSTIPGQTRVLAGSGILQMPAGCKLIVTSANGEITRIKSPPDTQVVQAGDLDLIVTGPDRLLQTKGIDHLNNTSTILAKAISEHLVNIEKQIVVTNNDVSYHWSIVLSLSIILGVVCIIMIILMLLLYRYSGRFRKKVRTVRTELQGVGDRIVAFEREAAIRARRNDRPVVGPHDKFDSIIRDLDQMEHRAKLNDYLDLGEARSPFNSKEDLNDFKNEGFLKYLDTSRPIPRARNIYPSVPPRSEIYSLTENYLARQADYEKLPLDKKSVAP